MCEFGHLGEPTHDVGEMHQHEHFECVFVRRFRLSPEDPVAIIVVPDTEEGLGAVQNAPSDEDAQVGRIFHGPSRTNAHHANSRAEYDLVSSVVRSVSPDRCGEPTTGSRRSSSAGGEDGRVRAEIFTVVRDGPGRISTMARPRGGEWLDDEMRALVDTGATVLVSMLTESERRELDLLAERDAATAAGLRFVGLPSADRGVPPPASFRALLDDLAEELRKGAHVVIHCRLGVGRSSLVAAGLLMREGHEPESAWEGVRRARGLEVPDTPEQRVWLERVARA